MQAQTEPWGRAMGRRDRNAEALSGAIVLNRVNWRVELAVPEKAIQGHMPLRAGTYDILGHGLCSVLGLARFLPFSTC